MKLLEQEAISKSYYVVPPVWVKMEASLREKKMRKMKKKNVIRYLLVDVTGNESVELWIAVQN